MISMIEYYFILHHFATSIDTFMVKASDTKNSIWKKYVIVIAVDYLSN